MMAQGATAIHACEESSSSFAPLPSNPEPRPVPIAAARPAAPVPAREIPAATHPRAETIELTPTVPPRVLHLPTEGLDQALLMALVARVVRLSAGFKVGANWTSQQAREAILGLLRVFGCPLWWIVRRWTMRSVIRASSWATSRWRAGASSGRPYRTGRAGRYAG